MAAANRSLSSVLWMVALLCTPVWTSHAQATSASHNNNWAVLVCTSRYWFNYRHMANTLSLYRTVKRLGIPDSNIILMLADDMACNARNSFPGHVFNSEDHALDLYGTDVEVDYRGYDVTVENFIRVLTGRHDPAVPQSKRMLSDDSSNILVYLAGHGGNEFMKFQDQEELMAADVADAVAQMWGAGRYREMLLVVETCQAATMYTRITAPNVLAMAASQKGESSYSYSSDSEVGLSLIDRFTRATLDFFERIDITSPATLPQLFAGYRYDVLESTFSYRSDLYPRPYFTVKVTDFFGSVTPTRHTLQEYPLEPASGGHATRPPASPPVGAPGSHTAAPSLPAQPDSYGCGPGRECSCQQIGGSSSSSVKGGCGSSGRACGWGSSAANGKLVGGAGCTCNGWGMDAEVAVDGGLWFGAAAVLAAAVAFVAAASLWRTAAVLAPEPTR